MRILTVRQPMAWAIIHGGKSPENRSRNIAGGYRGPVAIHAGAAYDTALVTNEVVQAWGRSTDVDDDHHPHVQSAIIGFVDLVDVHEGHPAKHAFGDIWSSACCDSPWAIEGNWHLELANPRPLPSPIPAKGRLGLWRPDADLLTELEGARAALHEATSTRSET